MWPSDGTVLTVSSRALVDACDRLGIDTRRAIGRPARSLESVARELGTSERSLQRHLREHGYTYAALADEVREATARLYLEQPDIALAEIAYLLGFADQSTFNRAFKRWTGCTPRQARVRVTSARRAGGRPRPRADL